MYPIYHGYSMYRTAFALYADYSFKQKLVEDFVHILHAIFPGI